jgi:hypothetical protein
MDRPQNWQLVHVCMQVTRHKLVNLQRSPASPIPRDSEGKADKDLPDSAFFDCTRHASAPFDLRARRMHAANV